MDKLDMIIDKVDRLHEIIFNEPVDEYNRIGLDINLSVDDYVEGMINGLEVALALLEDREPQFIDNKDLWLDSNDLMMGKYQDLMELLD